MTLHWLACDFRTGAVTAEFPDMTAQSLRRTIGQYNSTSLTFPVADTRFRPPTNWLDATVPYRQMMLALNEQEQPVWGGIINDRTRAGGKTVSLNVITPEAYSNRRYVRETLQYPQTDRLFIASDLINRYLVDGALGRNGAPIRVDIQSDGAEVDGDYQDSDDKTVYSVLQALGCEWTVTFERQDNPVRYTQVWQLSDRLGTPASPTMGPSVTFDWPGNLASAQIVESYGEGKGATDVMATSSGQGSVRPQSTHQVAQDPQRPVVEQRVSAGDNVTRLAALNTFARQVLTRNKNGSISYALTVPQTDPDAWTFDLGDDIGINLSGPEFPDNPTGVRRCAAIEITGSSTVSPILVNSDTDTDSDD